MTTYLIIGNGVAGNSAAESIRRTDPAGKIQIFSRQKYHFYYTPALPEYLAGEKELKDFTLRDGRWYEKNRIELFLDTEITRVDGTAKRAYTRRGEAFPYDKLLLACGGKSFVPPIPGSSSEGVFTLRTFDDAAAIRRRALECRKAVVIGGGLLGLEAGNGLRRAGLEVSVVEFFPRLLPRQTDPAAAGILQRKMEELGFRFFLGTQTREILSEKNGLRVCLGGGPDLVTDLVLISAGVTPEVELAKKLGLTVKKGIRADDHLWSGLDGVYVAGDPLEHRDRFYGIWPASMEQGKIAGANMAGGKISYEGTVPSNSLKVAGIDLVAAGETDPEGKLESAIRADETQKTYRKLVLRENRIVGAILLGDTRGKDEIQQAIRSKKDISSLKADLANFDFTRLG